MRMVWAHGDSVSWECPKSAIQAESMAWLEMFATWRVVGSAAAGLWSARDADAMALLAGELERTRDEQHKR